MMNQKHHSTSFFIFSLILVLAIFPTSANAKKEEKPFSAGREVILEGDDDGTIPSPFLEREGTVVEDIYRDEYVVPSLENMSRLYWRLGVHKSENDMAIDNFLQINECELYVKFYDDDFEWLRIRKAAREMLKKNAGLYSNKIKAQIPVDLGTYDIERGGFPLITNTSFDDVRRVNIGEDVNDVHLRDRHIKRKCHNYNVNGYPSIVLLIMDMPFSYDFVSVEEHIAQAFLVRRKHRPINNDTLRHMKRPAFARLRVQINKYGGQIKKRYASDHEVYIVFGELQGIDIFEDREEKRLLSTYDVNNPLRRPKSVDNNKPIPGVESPEFFEDKRGEKTKDDE